MKKTLITLAALAMASVASADTFTASPDVSADSTVTNCGSQGAHMYTLDFASSAAYSTTTSYTNVKLTSVAIELSTVGGYSDVNLAVYKVGTSQKDFTDFVALSSATTLNGSTLTFTFSTSADIDLSGTYAFVLAGTSYTADYLSTIQTGQTNLFYNACVVSDSNPKYFGVYSDDALSADNMMKIAGATAATEWQSNVTAAATYTFSGTPASVPEPTTATLSLLALAGLAARRRRK